MLEDEAGVREVERRLRKRVDQDVMLPHLDVVAPDGGEKSRVDVGGQHVTMRAHAIRQPTRDRAGTATNFEALPSVADATCEKMTNRAVVVHFCQGGQSRLCLRRGIVEHVRHRPSGTRAGLSPMMLAIS